MRSFFINRQYPVAIVDCAMHKDFSIDRATALTPKIRAANNGIPCTITFHPVNNSIKPLLTAILIYLIQIPSFLIFLVNAPFFFF